MSHVLTCFKMTWHKTLDYCLLLVLPVLSPSPLSAPLSYLSSFLLHFLSPFSSPHSWSPSFSSPSLSLPLPSPLSRPSPPSPTWEIKHSVLARLSQRWLGSSDIHSVFSFLVLMYLSIMLWLSLGDLFSCLFQFHSLAQVWLLSYPNNSPHKWWKALKTF